MSEKRIFTGPVFDGEKLIECAAVTVENGIITDIQPCETEKSEGLFIMPGLIDGHVHISDENQLKMFTDCGITTVCDVSVKPEIREKSDKLKIHSSMIMAKGDVEDAPAHVDATLAAGGDYVKLFIEIPPAMAPRTIPQDVLNEMVVSAHQKGLKVISHAASVPAQEMAIEAGVDILLHTAMRTATPEETVQKAKDKNLVFMPTILMMKLFTIEPFRDYEEQGFIYAQQAVKLFADMGVPVLVGTDANNSTFVPAVEHGTSMFTELEMLVDCGLTSEQVLQGVTALNADAFCLADRGRIAVGKAADFILVDGRPDKNISDIRNIKAVYINGEKV